MTDEKLIEDARARLLGGLRAYWILGESPPNGGLHFIPADGPYANYASPGGPILKVVVGDTYLVSEGEPLVVVAQDPDGKVWVRPEHVP